MLFFKEFPYKTRIIIKKTRSCSNFFDKISYDALQFTQIKVQNCTKTIKHEHNISFWQVIKLLAVTAVIYGSNSNTL